MVASKLAGVAHRAEHLMGNDGAGSQLTSHVRLLVTVSVKTRGCWCRCQTSKRKGVGAGAGSLNARVLVADRL